MSNTFSTELTKSEVKILLNILDKYIEKHTYGSPKEQETFDSAYKKLKIALFDLIFLDSNE